MEAKLPSSDDKPRWGQIRRLTFIDVRLQYDGRINRKDLIGFFNISMPQASADLALYQSKAPENLEYDPHSRTYVSLGTFRPEFGRSSATRYLDELNRLARGVVAEEESFIGFVPPTGVVDIPTRAIDSAVVATLVRAIRDRTALAVEYQSMDHPEPLQLVLSPHAVGFDGLRWHIRAWCHHRALFRDFAIGRLSLCQPISGIVAVDPSTDLGWHTRVPVILVPHPGLSPKQRDVVIRDFGMKDETLVLHCRKAMLFYTLRHLNLERVEIADNPATQHVVVTNRVDVQRWIVEDREGR